MVPRILADGASRLSRPTLRGVSMNIVFDIHKYSQTSSDKIEYNSVIFKAELPKEIDEDDSRDLWFFLVTLISGGALKLIVDMKNCEFIDNSGIDVLINATKLARNNNGEIILAGASDKFVDIFRGINLENYMKFFNSDGEAVKFLRLI